MDELERTNRVESSKTYLEQTKLLVTLSSAFLLPPAFVYTVLKTSSLSLAIITECCFAISATCGYVVFGSIAGSQRAGTYDVYRRATRTFSLIQFSFYLIGIVMFVAMVLNIGHVTRTQVQQPAPYYVHHSIPRGPI